MRRRRLALLPCLLVCLFDAPPAKAADDNNADAGARQARGLPLEYKAHPLRKRTRSKGEGRGEPGRMPGRQEGGLMVWL